jgi:hypothetical protein
MVADLGRGGRLLARPRRKACWLMALQQGQPCWRRKLRCRAESQLATAGIRFWYEHREAETPSSVLYGTGSSAVSSSGETGEQLGSWMSRDRECRVDRGDGVP